VINGTLSLEKLTSILEMHQQLLLLFSEINVKQMVQVFLRLSDATPTRQFWNLLLIIKLKISVVFSKWIYRNMAEAFGELGLIEILDLQVKWLFRTRKLKRLLHIYGIPNRLWSIFLVCVFILIEHQMKSSKWTKKITSNWSWEHLLLINWWVKEFSLMPKATSIMSKRRISKHLLID